MTRPRIIVEVRGGVVVAVYSSNKATRCDVLDRDNESGTPPAERAEFAALEHEVNTLHDVT